MTSKPLCIYHGNCADGFGAAWCVRHALGDDVEFHAGVHQDPPPDVTGRDVILVDFSYKRPVLLEMGKVAGSILVIDHHKSAAEDLAADGNYIVDFGAYTGPLTWQRFKENVYQDRCEGAPYARVYAIFDMDRSGAGMTWDFFCGGARPPLIDHIEDRDLWRFNLEGTREIQAFIFSYPYDFDVWHDLVARSLADADRQRMIDEGAAIERKHHKDVAELVEAFKRRMVIGECEVWAANLPYTLTSDAGHLMAQGEPFAACYWDTPDGRVFSLRSTDGGLDVSEVAKRYGGGGHRSASGFRLPHGQEP
jgi:oligoribonuclease NrnB/cAMP/cGMP phosphodiesterase (DHH superfamily)